MLDLAGKDVIRFVPRDPPQILNADRVGYEESDS